MATPINARTHAAELLHSGQIRSFFEIVDEHGDPHRAGDYESNAFETRAFAEFGVCALRRLGGDWALVRWEVREVSKP